MDVGLPARRAARIDAHWATNLNRRGTLTSGESPTGSAGFSYVEAAVACIAVAAQPVRFSILTGVTPGLVIAIALAPVWLSVLQRFIGGKLLAWLSVAGILSGLLTALVNAADHAVSRANLVAGTSQLLSVMAGLGVILWAREIVSVRALAASFALGMMVSAAIAPPVGDALKFYWLLPLAILILSIFDRHSFQVQLVGLGAVAILCVVGSFRSMMATCALAAMVCIWQSRPATSGKGPSRTLALALIISFGLAVYYTVSSLLVDGLLGEAAQERSIAQIGASGSLIVGGRPEIAATIALFRYQPLGFGIGVVPSVADVATAKAGLLTIGYVPDNGYVDRYMFGSHFELHSVIGDLWARFGLGGILLAVAMLCLTVYGVITAIVLRQAGSLLVVLALWNIWNMFFSPILSSVPALMIGLGLALRSRAPADTQPGARRPHPPSPWRRAPALARPGVRGTGVRLPRSPQE